jgi:hypothetical protein
MTGAAFGRQIQCAYRTYSGFTLWPNIISCRTLHADFSAKFEIEKHSFYITGSSVSKSSINTFWIYGSPQLDFIPLDILTEFPNLNGLFIDVVNLPTVKSGLFKPELQRIEYLRLYGTIESIEPEAFQYLINLKWVYLYRSNIQTLPYQIFKNNPDLFYIYLGGKINSIHSSSFDSLNKLKLIDFSRNNGCINDKIGCETCLITHSDLRGKLQGCFDNCSKGTACHTSFLSYETSQTTEIPQTTTKKSIESNSTEKVVEGTEELIDCQFGEVSQNFTASLRDTQMAVEGVKQELSDLKTSVETNNQNMQEIQECCTSNQKAVEDLATKVFEKTVETQFKNLKLELALMVQEKLDALQDRLENGGG